MYSLNEYLQTLPKASSESFSALLPSEVYSSYAKERNLTVERFSQSVKNHSIPTSLSTLSNKQIADLSSTIAVPRQKDYSSLIFDERYCGYLSNNHENNPSRIHSKNNHSYYTMAEGGTIPCAMVSALSFFKVASECERDLTRIAEHMVTYGYRKNGAGVLHIWFDWFVPNYYGLKVRRPLSINYMIDELKRDATLRNPRKGVGSVVVALVNSNVLGVNSTTSSAIVIWGINKGMYLYTSSHSGKFSYHNADEINQNIRACWILSKKD